MLQIVLKHLREKYNKNDDYIASQVLGLVFGNQLAKVKENVKMYLYPYIAKARGLGIAEE